VRALIALLNIKREFFPDDRRRRYYSKEDVQRMKEAVGRG
jgi:hypothetical protein